MPTLIPNRYSLDLTGTNLNNLVLGEEHYPAAKKIRTISPGYGPYFTDSLKVYNKDTNALLTRGIHYSCADIIGLPSAQSGKEIAALILLTDVSVVRIVIDYQSLGGGYEQQYTAIRQLMEMLNIDSRPILWSNILDNPAEFDPAMHLHTIGDVIGFEYLVASLEQLKNAILLGDDRSHDLLFTMLTDTTNNLNLLTGQQITTSAANAQAAILATTATANATMEKAIVLENKIDNLLLNTATILSILNTR